MLWMLWMLGSTAQSQDNALAWRWVEDQTYLISTELDMNVGYVQWFRATENHEARSGDFELKLALACVPGPAEKRAQMLVCDVHKVDVDAEPVAGDRPGALEAALADWEAHLSRASVELELQPNGRIRWVDLENVPKDTDREASIQETQRLLIGRALAPLEIEMPKDGVNPGKAWKQKGSPWALRLHQSGGTPGGIAMFHEVTSEQGSVAEITTTGQSTALDGNSPVALSLSGLSHFDQATGMLLDSTQVVTGTYTASSVTIINNSLYLQQKTTLRVHTSWDDLGW